MTKADIAQIIHQDTDLNKRNVLLVIDSMLNKISSTLSSGENVQISGFGHFTIREKSARIARNPKTGAPAEVSARRVVTFRPSLQFKQAMLEKDVS